MMPDAGALFVITRCDPGRARCLLCRHEFARQRATVRFLVADEVLGDVCSDCLPPADRALLDEACARHAGECADAG